MDREIILSDREIQLIVDSIRANEKHSRQAFGRWMTVNLGKVREEHWRDKLSRATAVFEELVALRTKFGDNKPVNLD